MPDSKLHQDKRDKDEHRPKKADSRLMEQEGETRSGSDSNAQSGRKQSRIHEEHKARNSHGPDYETEPPDFAHDLNPNNQAGENHGLVGEYSKERAHTAYDIKELQGKLADLTDDELKSILIVPEGTHLEQGARYLDLMHLEQDAFVAMSNMVAEPDHYYVCKKDIDYVLWNRLNQVEDPTRLDEAEPES